MRAWDGHGIKLIKFIHFQMPRKRALQLSNYKQSTYKKRKTNSFEKLNECSEPLASVENIGIEAIVEEIFENENVQIDK